MRFCLTDELYNVSIGTTVEKMHGFGCGKRWSDTYISLIWLSGSGFAVTIFAVHSLVVLATITPGFATVQPRWPHLQLTYPTFGVSSGVSVFLGADVWGLVVESGLRISALDESCEQAT